MIVVGVTGPANSGKSTVTRMMLELTPGATQIALAEPLKEFCCRVYDWPLERLEDQVFKTEPDPRYVRLSKDQIAALGWDNLIDDWHAGRRPEANLHEALGITFEECADWVQTGVVHLTPRFALQRLGTEWGRGCFTDTWINLAKRRTRDLQEAGCPLVVVSDVRFDNEVSVVDKIIEVTRPGVTRAAHTSEAGISPELVWAQVRNDSSLADLRERVADVLAGLMP